MVKISQTVGSSTQFSRLPHQPLMEYPLFPNDKRRNQRKRIVEERWNLVISRMMVKDIRSGSTSSSPAYLTAFGNSPSISKPTTEPTDGIVEERWNAQRHGNGQGYQQRK